MTAPAVLPILRDDLRFIEPDRQDRTSGGLVNDPARQSYVRISPEARQLLSLWLEAETQERLVSLALQRFGLVVTSAQVTALVQFLERNQLTQSDAPDAWRTFADNERKSRHGWIAWAIHNYLFVRLPLFRPDALLALLVPLCAPLFTRTAAFICGGIGALGLYLVSRQWDAFIGTFPYLFSLEAAAVYVVSLAIVKSLHELGHAVTAARYGCKVPTMGVCFMVMCPMLYTDVTDAWKLPSRQQRLAIDAAGLIVETALACVATFLWVFLPEGFGRSLAFAVATTGWILSLGMNLNPLMRFDGYYILADLMGIENLQARSFALARWRLREWLFDLGAAAPEALATSTRRWMIAYAYAVWMYRLVLFTGIALLVYHMAFKVLGIVLFAVEIVFFIVRPVWQELREWARQKDEIVMSRRTYLTGGVVVGCILAGCIPWSSRVTIPALVEAREVAQLYPVRAAVVVARHVDRGATLQAGQPIVTLASPELDQEIERTRLKRRAIETRLERRSSDATDRSETIVLTDMLDGLESKRQGLEAERAELTVVAPVAGIVAEVDPQLHVGRWVQRRDLIALMRSTDSAGVKGYVREDDLARIDLTAPARFVPDDVRLPSVPTRLERLSPSGAPSLDVRDLASHYGGAIAARPSARRSDERVLVPVEAQFLVSGSVVWPHERALPRTVRGTLIADGRAESFAVRAWRRIVQVLIRESGS